MPDVQISPMEDALVVENAVAEVADFQPSPVEPGLVLLGGRGIGKGISGKI